MIPELSQIDYLIRLLTLEPKWPVFEIANLK